MLPDPKRKVPSRGIPKAVAGMDQLGSLPCLLERSLGFSAVAGGVLVATAVSRLSQHISNLYTHIVSLGLLA